MLILALVTAYFSPQPGNIGLTEYAVRVCSEQATVVSGGRVYAAAQTFVRPASQATVVAMFNAAKRRSPWRLAANILEGAGWVAAALQASETIKIKERYKAMIPTGAATLRALTTFVRAEEPIRAVPTNLLGPWVEIPARGCAEHTMFAAVQSDERPFSVEVP